MDQTQNLCSFCLSQRFIRKFPAKTKVLCVCVGGNMISYYTRDHFVYKSLFSFFLHDIYIMTNKNAHIRICKNSYNQKARSYEIHFFWQPADQAILCWKKYQLKSEERTTIFFLVKCESITAAFCTQICISDTHTSFHITCINCGSNGRSFLFQKGGILREWSHVHDFAHDYHLLNPFKTLRGGQL